MHQPLLPGRTGTKARCTSRMLGRDSSLTARREWFLGIEGEETKQPPLSPPARSSHCRHTIPLYLRTHMVINSGKASRCRKIGSGFIIPRSRSRVRASSASPPQGGLPGFVPLLRAACTATRASMTASTPSKSRPLAAPRRVAPGADHGTQHSLSPN